MIALSIRQPWAWLILRGGKDIENRGWPTKFRGRVLVHAPKGCTRAEYEDGVDALWQLCGPVVPAIELPPLDQLERGGLVGSVEIVDCVTSSRSPWFCGRFGFMLRDPKPITFVPWKGQLGFFEVPEAALPSNAELKGGASAPSALSAVLGAGG